VLHNISGIWWSLSQGVQCLWHHTTALYSRFQTNASEKFVDATCILFYTHSPFLLLYNLICHYIEFELLALQLRSQDTGEKYTHVTTGQFTSAKTICVNVLSNKSTVKPRFASGIAHTLVCQIETSRRVKCTQPYNNIVHKMQKQSACLIKYE